jgi:hypothetical protein
VATRGDFHQNLSQPGNSFSQNTVGAGSDTLTGFENLTGSQFNDTLTGSAGANTIIGGSGSDKIAGAGGADTLTGGIGADIFIFKAAADSAPGLADFITDFLAGTDKIDLSLSVPVRRPQFKCRCKQRDLVRVRRQHHRPGRFQRQYNSRCPDPAERTQFGSARDGFSSVVRPH